MIDEEKQKHYIDLLERGIKDEDVYNIALTGPYGSGKSSIIKGLLAKEGKSDIFLEISLANFQSGNVSAGEKNKAASDQLEEQQIEKSILQQILYKVSRTTVPYSRFSRILNYSSFKLASFTALFLVWILTFYFTTDNQAFSDFLSRGWVLTLTNLVPKFISSYFVLHSIFMISSAMLLYALFKGGSMLKVNKLSFQGTNIELGGNKGSLLNEHLDEILYFFETTSYKVVIIEDLDRHEIANVFKTLREINTLINNYEKITEKVTFLYAVKDSLFTGEERTKFFEWIVPVIPVINTSNAKDKLIGKIEEAKLEKYVNNAYLKDIAYYITDLRQLTNIFNEFIVYNQELANIPDQEILFSLIIYKNFFPHDFSRLHNKEGYVHEIFHTKEEEIRDGLLEKLKEQLTDIETQIELSTKESLRSAEELKDLFIFQILKEEPDIHYVRIQGQEYTLSDISRTPELFKQFKENNIDLYFLNNGQTIQSNYTFDKDLYNERAKRIVNKKLSKRQKLRKEKRRIENDIGTVSYLSLEKLLKLLPFDKREEVLLPSDVEKWSQKDKYNWGLIVKLITNGYINDDYPTYISYFYDTEMSTRDHFLIQDIKHGKTISYTQDIDNITLMIEDLSVHDFTLDGVLTMSFLKVFLEDREGVYSDKKERFFETLFNGTAHSNKLLIRALKETRADYIPKLLRTFVSYEKDLWRFLGTEYANFENNEYESLVKSMLQYISNEDILAFENIDEIKNTLSYWKHFLDFSIDFTPMKKLKDLLIEMDIKFSTISINKTENREVFDIIYDNNLYAFTPIMLASIISVKLDIESVTDLSYGAIVGYRLDRLTTYIQSNINAYADEILIKENYIQEETEEGMIDLLKDPQLDGGKKKELLTLYKNSISKIKQVPNKYWDLLLIHQVITPLWSNVYYAYIDNRVENTVLLKYLSEKSVYTALSEHSYNASLPSDVDKEKAHNLLVIIVHTAPIEALATYKKSFHTCLSEKDTDIEFSEMHTDRMLKLVEAGYICVTPDNYNAILSKLNTIESLTLILKDVDVFITDYDAYQISNEAIKLLLTSGEISSQHKMKILSKTSDEALGEEGFYREIYTILMAGDPNLSGTNLYTLISFSLHNLDAVEEKVKLLTKYIPWLDDSSITECIAIIGVKDKEYLPLNKSRKHSKLKKTAFNLAFAEALENRERISSYSEEETIIKTISASSIVGSAFVGMD